MDSIWAYKRWLWERMFIYNIIKHQSTTESDTNLQQNITTVMEVHFILCLLLAASPAAFAGRAFTFTAKHFVGDLFRKLSPRIDLDHSNYLTVLSERYSLCKHMGLNGHINVKEKTPAGSTIGGLTATSVGGATDANSILGYIKHVMPDWLTDPAFNSQIKSADKFGCSIQANCRGNFTIVCLFSPEYRGHSPSVARKGQSGYITYAFTQNMQKLAQSITGKRWDSTHLLENMSGEETDCAMLHTSDWSFNKAKNIASMRRMNIETVYGFTQNIGVIENAVIHTLQLMKPDFAKYKDDKIGCSVIPNCRHSGKSYVVVSCIISS